MADEKKFLDQAGVQYLWSQLSMEDYPNNETLIAVLNAIDQTKADKEEVDKQIAVMNDRVVATDDGELTNVLPDMFGGHTPDEYMLKAEMPEVEKSDWSVNDENDAAYIKNRTHWTDDDGTVHKIDEKYLPDIGVRSWNDLTDKPFGDNADGTVYPISGKYVEGMGWSEKSVSGKVVVEETAYRVNNSTFGELVNPEPLENGSYAAMPTEFSFESGKTYRITVDGVPYIGTAEYRDGYGNFGGGDGVPLVDENGGYHGVFVTAMGAGYSNYFYYDEGPEVGHTGTFIIEEVTEVETIHPIDQKLLGKISGKYVEGMGYTETITKEVPALLVNWDGNTDGRANYLVGPEDGYCHVSDIVFEDYRELLGKTVHYIYKGEKKTAVLDESMIEEYIFGDVTGFSFWDNEIDYFTVAVFSLPEETKQPWDDADPLPRGLYFSFDKSYTEGFDYGSGYVIGIDMGETTIETSKVIHPIDQKFLNVLRVKFDTADGQNFTGADKTIDEIIEAFKNGKTIVGYYEMDMDGRYVGGELLLCGVNKTDSMKACTFNTFVIAGTSMVAQLLTYKEFDGETTITLTTHTSAN